MIDISHEFTFLNGAWHLAYYIPRYKDNGPISDYILRFKKCVEFYLQCWTVWSFDELSNVGIHFDYIVRALGSDELKVSRTNGLDCLGGILEENLPSAKYVPETLGKNILTPSMHSLNTIYERQNVIHNSYFVADLTNNFNNKNILILDDITTSGTTIREIHRALKEVWPNGRYHLFCLGKTNHDENANDNIPLNHFI